MEELLHIVKNFRIIFDCADDRLHDAVDVEDELGIFQCPDIVVTLPETVHLFFCFFQLGLYIPILTFRQSILFQLPVETYGLGREVSCKKSTCTDQQVEEQVKIQSKHRHETGHDRGRYGDYSCSPT